MLEAKNGSCRWESLENLFLKQIANFLKKKNYCCCYSVVLFKKHFFCAVSTSHLYFILKKMSFSPTALHLFTIFLPKISISIRVTRAWTGNIETFNLTILLLTKEDLQTELETVIYRKSRLTPLLLVST